MQRLCVIGRGWTEDTTHWFPKGKFKQRTDYLIDPTGRSSLGCLKDIEGPAVINRDTAFYIDIKEAYHPDLTCDIVTEAQKLTPFKGKFEWVWVENVGQVSKNKDAMKAVIALSKKYVAVSGGNVTGAAWGEQYMSGCHKFCFEQVETCTYVPEWYVRELELACADPELIQGYRSPERVSSAYLKSKYAGQGTLQFLKPQGKFSAELSSDTFSMGMSYYVIKDKVNTICGLKK